MDDPSNPSAGDEARKHFHGRFEVERKYRLPSADALAAFRARLVKAGAVAHVEDNRETDLYFERAPLPPLPPMPPMPSAPATTLKAEDKSLILRDMAPSGIRLMIVKGPGPDLCRSLHIDDVADARAMLESIGFHVAFTLVKTRSVFFAGDLHVTCDVVPDIGHFAEVAAMTDDADALPRLEAAVTAFAADAGLSDAMRETRGYRQLIGQ